MGIPYYYYRVLNDFPIIISPDIKNVHVIAIDSNGLYHNVATIMEKDIKYQKKNHEAYEDMLVCGIKAEFKSTISKVGPKKCVIISVDGPAPRSKMRQQYQRRVKKPIQEHMENEIRENLGLPKAAPKYDRNNISPGTPLMAKINRMLIELAEELSQEGLTVVLSNSNEPGEGEHKIFNYIKRHYCHLKFDPEDPDKTEKIVVVGLDADLIMLSLVSHFNTIYLMRISTDPKTKLTECNYLDTGLFRHLLISQIRNDIAESGIKTLYTQQAGESIIDDYIFLCFLLGNDFLPHSPILNIRDNGINKLLNLYAIVFNETKQHLVTVVNRHQPGKTKTHINIEPFRRLINAIAENEDMDMFKLHQKRSRFVHNFPRMKNPPPHPTDLDDALHVLEFKPVEEKNIIIERNLNMNGNIFKDRKTKELYVNPHHKWKQIYFDNVLRLKRNRDNITRICHNYLVGLDWVLSYYYTEHYSWGWIYQYLASPIFQDLKVYLNNVEQFPTETKEEFRPHPYSPLAQLMMIMPKTSSALLPSPLAGYMTRSNSSLRRFYPDPKDIELNYFFHMKFYEAEPIVDMIDDRIAEDVVAKTLPKLTKEEKARNQTSTTIVLKGK